MSVTTAILIALLAWMVWMHVRPGGHGGCCGHDSGSHSDGERNGR